MTKDIELESNLRDLMSQKDDAKDWSWLAADFLSVNGDVIIEALEARRIFLSSLRLAAVSLAHASEANSVYQNAYESISETIGLFSELS